MSLFVRSISGLRNYSIFTQKRITAFCEGGTESISPANALAGLASESSEDITFWDIVTEVCAKNKEFHIKAVGDTNAIHALAEHIVANDIRRVCVFSDRDWRSFSNTFVRDNRIVYTPDYSWENTVVRPDVIAGCIVALGNLPRRYFAIARQKAADYLQRVKHALRWPVYLDVSAIGSGASFVDKTEFCGGAIGVNAQGELFVSRVHLEKRVGKYWSQYKRTTTVTMAQTSQLGHVPGHILMGAAISIVQSFLRERGVRRIPKGPAIRAAMLQEFKQLFAGGSWRREKAHFRNALAGVPSR